MLREAYPGVPVVTYVNTTAAVKAESDICCTSSNAVQVVESLGAPRVILIPDEFLAKYVRADQGRDHRLEGPLRGARALHRRGHRRDARGRSRARDHRAPRVPARGDGGRRLHRLDGGHDRLGEDQRPSKVVLITECSMASNVAAEAPDIEFVRPCNLCPHMKRISLENIYLALRDMRYEVTVDPAVAAKARRAVERMVDLTN